MVMVSSAVLGAAVGSGLALMVAVTIVMYRYYLLRKRGKEWDELDRWEETRIMRKLHLKVSQRYTLLHILIGNWAKKYYILRFATDISKVPEKNISLTFYIH